MDEATGRRGTVRPSQRSRKSEFRGARALDAAAAAGFHRPVRIIAGEFRSRRLSTPPDAEKTRPMPDRVREGLFNLLRGHTEGQSVVDVFAGTGSVGLEALSRGAARCVFIERDREIGAILKANIEALGVGDRSDVVLSDALGPGSLARVPRPVHLVFFDPPYPLLLEEATRRRVYEQFARFVSLLDDEGYAALRTPWPYRTPPVIAAGVGEGPEERGDAQADDVAPPGAIIAPGEEIDLAIPGALGPETHLYGSTALHLYMRDPAAG